MTMDIVVRLVLLAPYGLILLSLALNAWRLYLVYRDSATRRPIDVSGQRRPVPMQLSDRANEVKLLGFQRLGELEVALPAVGIVRALTRRTERHTAWIFVDPARTTEAAVVPNLVEFSSRHADGSYVETMYPIGEQINEPSLAINRVRSSVKDAYMRHLAVVDARVPEHGAPRLIETMADQAVHDADYRIQHARRQLRRPLIFRNLLPIAATAVFIAALTWLAYDAIDTIARVTAR